MTNAFEVTYVDIDVYRIRSYKFQFMQTRAGPVTIQRIKDRIGGPRVFAHYDPGIGYTGLEWAFRSTEGEHFLLYQEYQTIWISNARGGIQLKNFGDWLASVLDQPETEPEPDNYFYPTD